MTSEWKHPVLPEMPDRGLPGFRFVRRATAWTLVVIATLIACVIPGLLWWEVQISVSATGALEPSGLWIARAPLSGIVKDVHVRMGDTVGVGQPLVSFDPRETQGELQQLEAEYKELSIEIERAATGAPLVVEEGRQRLSDAIARVTRARANLRSQLLEYGHEQEVDVFLEGFRPGMHVGLDLAASEAQSAAAELAVQQARLQLVMLDSLSLVRQRLELASLARGIEATRGRLIEHDLIASRPGVVISEGLDRLPRSMLQEGDPVVEIAELGNWHVSLTVSERDVHRVKIGDSVRIDVPALEPQTSASFDGRVIFVAQTPGKVNMDVLSQSSGAYRVVVALDSGQVDTLGAGRLRLGYQARGKIITAVGTPARLLLEKLFTARSEL